MSTTYGFKKQVTRNQQGSSLTLASLMGMLRSSLGAAWEQARSRQEYTHRAGGQLTRAISPEKGTYVRRLTKPASLVHEHMFIGHRTYVHPKAFFLTVLMLVAITGVWGQTTDYSGTYYIKSASDSKSPDGNYYFCPTEEWAFFQAIDNVNSTDNGQPFLTTHIMGSGDEAKYVWIVEKYTIGDHDYYAFKHNIKHEGVSRYLSYNRQLTGAGVDRMRIHLKKTETPGDYELFDITPKSTNLVIMPKIGDEDDNNTRKYLVVNGGNTNYFQAYYVNAGGVKKKENGPSGFTLTTGIIGTYSDVNDVNNPFIFEKAKCKTPVITYDNVTSKVTITSDNDETIYYTTDGSNPDANSNEYSEPFTLNAGAVIKAISKKDGIIDSEIATLTVVKLATPVITFNEETREATITAAEGVEIYYTTNDTDPAIEETTAHGASPVVIAHALPSTKIHAQAVKSGSINSDIATKTDIPVKVLTNPTIILAEDEFVYDGSAKQPAVTVQDGDVVVSADEYVVAYSSNTNAGTASITVSDKAGGDYQVNGSKTFTISPKSIGDGNVAADGIIIEMTSEGDLSSVKDGETTLVLNTDYTYTTETVDENKVVTITGKGNYQNSAKGIYANPPFIKPEGETSAAAVYTAMRDLANPAGIKPYIIRKVNPSIGTMVISELDYIPEGVPVLLLSDAEAEGFVAAPKDPSTPEVTDGTKNSNQLKVSAGGETVQAAQIYMFYQGEFVLTKAGTLGEGNYYLYNPNYNAQSQTAGSNSGSASSRGSLQIVFEDETTGISELNNSKIEEKETETDVWYTLEGQRIIGKPSKGGIYIRKGQKIFLKRN